MSNNAAPSFRSDDKKPSPPSVLDSSSTSTGTGTGVHPELMGDHHDSPGAHDTPEAAFHAANGFEAPGRDSKFSVSQYSANVGQGEGISRGQIVKYTDDKGNVLQGGQYHNKDGTFFKTPEGDTYKVQAENGKYSLQPTAPGQQPIEASHRDVVSNNFGKFNNERPATTPGDNGNGTPQVGGDNGGNGNGNGRRTTPAEALDPATTPGAATKRSATEQPISTVPNALDKVTPSGFDRTQPERVAPNPDLSTRPNAGPLTPAAATQFYDQYKRADDATQNRMVQQALQTLPPEDTKGFFRQVARAGMREDGADAKPFVGDLAKTIRSTAAENNGAIQGAQTPKIDGPKADLPAAAGQKLQESPVAATPGQKLQESPVAATPGQKLQESPVAATPGQKLQESPVAATPGQKLQDNPIASRLQDVVGAHDSTVGKFSQPSDSVLRAPIDKADIAAMIRASQQTPERIAGQIPASQIPGDKISGDNRGLDRSFQLQGGQLDRGDKASIDRALQGPGSFDRADKLAGGIDKGQIDRGPAQNLDRIPPGVADKLQNLTNQMADRSVGADRGHGGDNLAGGAGLQNLGRTKDGGDQVSSLPSGPQKNLNSGFDLHDPQTKQFLADALKTIQANKIGDFDPRSQSNDLRDILKGFDPHRVERLQAFLNPDGKTPLNDAAVGRLALLLQHSERVTGTGATDLSLTLPQRTAIDRLTDFVRANQNMMDWQNMQMRDGRFMHEINRMVFDVNRQFGLDGRNALTLGDILGRSLDGTRGGERGHFEGRGPLDRPNLDPLSFTARMSPMQEQALRAFLDARETNRLDAARLAELQHGMLPPTRPIEPTRPDLVTRLDVKAELANKPMDHKADLPVKNELANKAEITGKGELPGKADLPGRGELAGKELAGRELPGKVEMPGRNEPNKGELAGKPDIIRPEHGTRHDGVKDKTDKTDGVQGLIVAGKLEGRDHLDPNKKLKDERELAEKQKEDRERQEEEAQRREAALMALMADRKMRENKEKQEKEQERQQEKKQDEEARRRRYVVRERDTLESIAAKQLKDGKLAPLIHELNIKEITLKTVNGKEVPDLRARQVIWLPSGVDIREYRKRMHSGSNSQSANDEKLSAEEELAARFGENWDGTASGGAVTSGGTTILGGAQAAPSAPEVSPEAVAAAQKRRANIESLLGPISKQTSPDGRVHYVVRLGDTLKSVAMKHPALQDIALWQLLAAVNDIPTDTDERGVPKARLGRGSTLMMPTAEEIQEYRDANGTRQTRLLTKTCPKCGRASAMSASTCGGCAHSFNVDKTHVTTQHDAGMVVMQAAGFVNKPGVPLKQPVITGSIESNEAPVIPPPLYAPDTQLALTTLDDRTRIARCIVHNEIPCTVVAVEVLADAGWQPVVAYEIFFESSVRHEYNPRGERKSVRIDLPTDATLELSNNDLTGNWKNYRDRYLAEKVTLNR